MFIPEKMRINKFKDVAIPQNKDYFARLAGNVVQAPAGAYTGDEPVHIEGNKTDELYAYARYAEMKANEAKSKSNE